jgi:hypothetical protein
VLVARPDALYDAFDCPEDTCGGGFAVPKFTS